jgi:hypothetical protein
MPKLRSLGKGMLFAITAGYVITCIIWGILGYDIYSVDAHGTPIRDGLGRSLYPSPWLFRYFFGADERWPGARWFLCENLVFWIVNGLLYHFWRSTSQRKKVP